MTSIASMSKQADFALAAYATLPSGISGPALAAALVGVMSNPQAARFASTYTVVEQYAVPSSGLSATVFTDSSGQKFLAIRGTDDGYDLATDAIDIALLGSTANQAQYAELKAKVQAWIDDGILSSSFTVSGHSLGGFLATGIAADFAAKVTHAYLYNAPGLGGIVGTILSPFDELRSALGIGESSIDPAKVSNIKAEAGISPIAGLGIQVAPVISIVIENQFLSDVSNPPAARNHSLEPLDDALALYAAFAGLDASLVPTSFDSLLQADSEQNRLTLESALDIARRLLLGRNAPPTPIGGRDEFYSNLYGLTSSDQYLTLAGASGTQVTVLAGKAAIEIIGLAGMNDSTGLAVRYALKELNPFTLIGADYSALNADGALNPYNVDSEKNGLTPRWLQDRADFLERKLYINGLDTDKYYQVPSTDPENPLQPPDAQGVAYQNQARLYVDLGSGFTASSGPNPDALQNHIFGTDYADVVYAPVSGREDWLYGSGGTDFLAGYYADDYLEGGAGFDVYQFYSGNAADTVLDTDGEGLLVRNGAALALGVSTSADVWQLGGTTYTRDGTDLLITFADTASDKITVRDFDFAAAQAGSYLGIRLVDSASLPNGTSLLGDRTLVDTDSQAAGVQIGYDLWGNELTEDPAAARDDALYGSDGASEHIEGREGNDVIFGDTEQLAAPGPRANPVSSAVGAADFIEGGAGRDIVTAGAGGDWVEGGADGDILGGSDGNDAIYADSSLGQTLTVGQAVSNGNIDNPTAGLQDLLTGDAGDDQLISSTGADYLAGGEGHDVIVGGAGDDTIYGDRSVINAPLDWSITRTVDEQNNVATYIVTASSGFTTADDAGAGDVIYAGAGADWVFAGGGDDFVDTGSGLNVVLGEGGNDTIFGGENRDILDGDSADSNDDDTYGNDYVDGGGGNDSLFGGKGNDILIGGTGQDQLQGGDGEDVLYGGTDTDVLQGGDKKDTYLYFRGDGYDIVSDPDIAKDSPYLSMVVLGPGITKADVKFRLGSLVVDLGGGDALEFVGFDAEDPLSTPMLDGIEFADGGRMTFEDILAQGFDIDGTEGDDVIQGTAVTDRINALGGDDDIYGKAGEDTIEAGSGNDIVEAGAGNDTITTGAGADIVFGGAGDDTVVAGDGDLIIDTEGTNQLDLTAYTGLTEANLEITQYQAPDGETYLNFHVRDDLNPGVTPGTGGVSVQKGELGSFATVTLDDGAGGTVAIAHADLMQQYTAQGLVYGGSGASETLVGTPFADTFFGGAGADTIQAGAGDDRIDGGKGEDVLEGGAGNDTYLLAYNGERDTVIEDGSAEPNAVHTVQLDAGIASSQVKATRMGEDLEVRLKATADALVIKDFYLQPSTWQAGWQLRDANGVATVLTDYVPVVPPAAGDWLTEEADAFRARREQVFAANRSTEGYNALGGNVFQNTDQVFPYSGHTSNTATSTHRRVRVPWHPANATLGLIGTLLTVLLLAAWSGSPAHAADKATKKVEARYQLVAGMGYTVCERYIKMLNALPAEAPPPICEQKLHPEFRDFRFPAWEQLDVTANIELIRQMEQWLHSKNPAQWEDRRQPPTLDEWLAEVERRIRTGEAAPRLRRAELALSGTKRERILAYTRDTGQCERDLVRYGATWQSWDHIFLYDEQGRIDPRKLDVLGGTRDGRHQVMLHNGKPYFVSTYADAPKSEPIKFHVQVAERSSGSAKEVDGIAYFLPQRCVVELNSSKVK